MIVYFSTPSLVALICKLALLGYSARSPIKNIATRLFLALLAVLSIDNLLEFVGFNYFPPGVNSPLLQVFGFAYLALWIPGVALLLQLCIALSFDNPQAPTQRPLFLAIYLPVLALECLLIFTDELVTGFQPFMYTVLRVPGRLYILFEAYLTVYLSLAIGCLTYGSRISRPALARMRNRLWLLALAPMVTLMIYLIVANHFRSTHLTSTFYVPVAMTFFLLVTTYATHERPRPGGFYRFLYRLFDIESYLPWSRTYRRKTVLYGQLRKMASEVDRYGSVAGIVERLADALLCPVVLVNRHRAPILVGETSGLAQFPRDALQHIDRIVVAHEVARAMPRMHALMTRHKVAAIVPFHPHSRNASWMLLGEAFTEQVYTPIDFDVVRELFHRLSDYFLDEQLRMRSQLDDAQRETLALRQRLAATTQQLQKMEEELKGAETVNGNSTMADDEITAVRDEMSAQVASGKKTLDEYVSDFERRLIEDALERAGGNQAKAAALLGLRPNTLHYKIRRYSLGDGKKTS